MKKIINNMLVVPLIRQPSVLEEGIQLQPTEKIAVNFWGEFQSKTARSFTKTDISFEKLIHAGGLAADCSERTPEFYLKVIHTIRNPTRTAFICSINYHNAGVEHRKKNLQTCSDVSYI